MRKIILSIASIIAINVCGFCQQPFPDGGFENCWKRVTNPTPGKADYWDFNDNYFLSTLNQLHELDGDMGNAPLTAEREEGDAYEGSYSLKVVSRPMSFGGTTIFLPGVAATLAIQFLPSLDCIMGEPFTSRPTAITGYYKYVPVNGDSAAIEVNLKSNGTEIGKGKEVITNASNWTRFYIPINYTGNETPDSIVVILASSAMYDFTGGLASLMQCQGQEGSTLYLDEIEFDYTVPENIMDGGFETCWENKQTAEGGEYEDFKDDYFFNSLNLLHAMLGAPLTAIKESNDVHAGNYALKLVSENLTIPVMGSIFLPGATGNITLQPAAGMPPVSISLGSSFTSRPKAIKGWHKYAPVDGDSAAVEILLKKNGIEIGRGKQVITNEVSAWSQFRVPINYASNENPDTIVILFASSAMYDFSNGIQGLLQCAGQVGSALYLDDLELDYSVGIKEMLTPEIAMRVYPNPSKEQITVQIAKEVKGTVIVYDYLSRKVGEYPVNGNQINIDIQKYAAGSYLLNVVENNKVITTNRFVKQ
ncbi:MAG: PCMD domain-containing protein [Bacteroidales bacterium]|jgi:hypothetical protein|nr:PCMD domain-containing protein [Bacteroidales bacterium]